MLTTREEAERLAAEERERAKRERRCPECGNKVLSALEITPKSSTSPQTFGEDSEMLAEDLYYHRVLINSNIPSQS